MLSSSPSASAPSTLSLVCKRWDARPWEHQELVVYKARVERETEKAVLLVDASTAKRRRSCWLPKRALLTDNAGCLSAWACGKLDSAGFGETDVISLPGR